MTEKLPPRTGIVPSDMDAQGNVTLWDHGPQVFKEIPGETDEAKASRQRAYDADAKLWHDTNGDAPLALVMHSSDASHSMMIEPDRYALEPRDLDEGEIEKRVKEKKDKREAARDFVQNTIDRREAIAELMSDREQKRLTEKAAETHPSPVHHDPFAPKQPAPHSGNL